jgi:glycosyltransferase involved in cell wall biosynthesis
MVTKDLVSVIIPVYNGERFLAEAIDSVLAQTYSPVELIVLNDGSTDSSAQIVARYGARVRHHYQANAGLAAAQNAGARLARGSFISYLDADDLWLANKLECQVLAFECEPDLDVVFGHVQQFQDPEGKGDSKMVGAPMPGYSTGTMLMRRGAFFDIGPFDEKWRVGEFVEWYIRALERGVRSSMLPDVVMQRRIHDRNMGISLRKHQRDYLRILKASLDRRRSSSGSNPDGRA